MKIKKFIGCTLVIVGTLLILGAIGGLEHDTYTISETLKTSAAGFGMVLISYLFLKGVTD